VNTSQKLIGKPAAWLETVGAVCLFAMMAVTFIDVTGRSLFSRPLVGSTDLVQVLLALTAACTLPSVTWRNEHLSIGLFDGVALTPAERIRRMLVAAIGAVVFAAMSVLLWRYGGETARNGDVIGYLRIPVSPMVYAVSVLAMVTAAASAALVVRAARGLRGEDAPSTAAAESGVAK
jgi:TRAP-type C4-dicarboxylate transport system permease small subunit